MKKIRILSLLLVILMLAMPILSACNNDPDDPDIDEEESGKNPSTPSRRPGSGTSGSVVTEETKDGYVVYTSFDKLPLGTFSNTGSITQVNKTGVTYTIVEAENGKEGDATPRAIRVLRAPSTETTNRDGYIAIKAADAKLNQSYIVEFDFMVTEKTLDGISFVGRKAATGGAKFNTFLSFNAKSRSLSAAGTHCVTMENNVWYTISMIVHDELGKYDVCVDGWLVAKDISVTATYPKKSETPLDLYRMQMGGTTGEHEYLMDNIHIYNSTDPAVVLPNDYKGSKIPTYDYITLPDAEIFNADDMDFEAFIDYYISTVKEADRSKKQQVINANIGSTDSGFNVVGINSAGTVEALSTSVDTVNTPSEGYSKYLLIGSHKSLCDAPSFALDKTKMAAVGIQQNSDGKSYDVSNYQKIRFEFYVPFEDYEQAYKVMLMLYTGDRNGMSYHNASFYSTDTRITNNGGFFVYEADLSQWGVNRDSTLTTVQQMRICFSGWTTNGINGSADDAYPLYLKSCTLIGGYEVVVADAEKGKENCTHKNPNGSSTMELKEIEPTCLTMGYAVNRCSLCGKETAVNDTSYIKDPLGHSYEGAERIIVHALCDTSGYADAACIRCGVVSRLEDYPALGHDFDKVLDMENGLYRLKCNNCGYKSSSIIELTDTLPTYAELITKINADRTLYTKGDASNSKSMIGGTLSLGAAASEFDFILRGTEVQALDNAGVDGVDSYTRFIHTKASKEHSYANLWLKNYGKTTPFVFDFTIRLGQPGSDGKYTSSNFQFIDRSFPNDSKRLDVAFAKFNTDGSISFINDSRYTIKLSQTKFTNIAMVVMPESNSIDVYVDGVWVATGLKLHTNAAEAAKLTIDEIRFLQYSVSSGGNDCSVDVGNVLAYSGSTPVAFTGVELKVGEIKTGTEYDGDITLKDFESADTEELLLNGATVTDGKLVLNNTEGAVDATVLTDSKKNSSHFTLDFEFYGNADAPIVSTKLLTAVKNTWYGASIEESVLRIDGDSDILFYGQIIGNASAEKLKLSIEFNDEIQLATVYIDGKYIASAYYENPDFCAPEDGKTPALAGFKFFADTEGGYAIDNLYVYTGAPVLGDEA